MSSRKVVSSVVGVDPVERCRAANTAAAKNCPCRKRDIGKQLEPATIVGFRRDPDGNPQQDLFEIRFKLGSRKLSPFHDKFFERAKLTHPLMVQMIANFNRRFASKSKGADFRVSENHKDVYTLKGKVKKVAKPRAPAPRKDKEPVVVSEDEDEEDVDIEQEDEDEEVNQEREDSESVDYRSDNDHDMDVGGVNEDFDNGGGFDYDPYEDHENDEELVRRPRSKPETEKHPATPETPQVADFSPIVNPEGEDEEIYQEPEFMGTDEGARSEVSSPELPMEQEVVVPQPQVEVQPPQVEVQPEIPQVQMEVPQPAPVDPVPEWWKLYARRFSRASAYAIRNRIPKGQPGAPRYVFKRPYHRRAAQNDA
jgi:hypothetical protein